jgi:murein DD-endopeptidase MepM/ murein hydrolase activator NlpD
VDNNDLLRNLNRKRRKRGFPVIRVLLAGLLVYFSIAALSGRHNAPQILNAETNVETKKPPPDSTVPMDAIRWNETLFSVLLKHGVGETDRDSVIRALKSVYGGTLYKNQEYHVAQGPDSAFEKFMLKSKDRCTLFTVLKRDGGFRAGAAPLPLTKMTTNLSGTLESSLYEAIEAAGERPELIINFIDLFSWDINWFTDPRTGDQFRMTYEKYYSGGEFIKYGRILAACYVNDGKPYYAYRFNPDTTLDDYFNENGVSLRKSFLKAPLRYHRVSSRFSYSRLHPILKYRRPHLGIDYAAPVGTPVSAAADGKVVFAGSRGGYGKLVIIYHENAYRTQYGHLRRFARGIRVRNKVKQGQVIGYVGSSGLSTGPHLDFRVQRGKTFINPLSIRSSPVTRVPEKYSADFQARVAELNQKLNVGTMRYAGNE